MRIHARELEEGYILEKDIIGKTGRPIVRQQTVLTDEHIRFIHAFLVEDVYVSPKTIDGEHVKPSKKTMHKIDPTQPQRPIRYMYENAVQFMIDHFQTWRQHLAVDMPAIRYQMIPLLDRVEEEKSFLQRVHLYATNESYMYHHSVAMSLLSSYVARRIGYDRGESIQVGLAALFADSGMSHIDEKIPTSSRPLRAEEVQLVHEHPLYSYRMVEPIQTLTQGAKVAVLQHHERLNGTGYPLGVQGKRIHPYAHIIAVCDMYHAMASERPYQEKQSIYRICEEIWEERNVTLQGKAVEAFVDEFAPLSVGNPVVLSNGKRGKIVFIHPDQPMRPIIQIHDTDELYPLGDYRDIYIEEVL